MDWDKFKFLFSDSEFVDNKIVIKSALHETIQYVKENYNFNILKEIIAIHKYDNEIELIYHLYSTVNEEDLLISISVVESTETVSDIFDSANADENEIFDLFGIKFEGNNDLKRLYMPESWEGYPLRKDYVQNDMRLSWNGRNDNNV